MSEYINKSVQTDITYMGDLNKLQAIESLILQIDKIFKGEMPHENLEENYKNLIGNTDIDENMENNESDSETDKEDELENNIILSEDDITELTITINHLIEDYLDNNILDMKNSEFINSMRDNIAQLIYLDLVQEQDNQFQDNKDYIEIVNLVENQIDMYLRYNQIPQRSNSITIDDMEELTKETSNVLTTILNKLDTIPQPVQKTKEWYEFRYNLISASNLWKVFGSQSQINSLIYEKCKPLEYNFTNYGTNNSLHWGVKYEPVTIMIYEHMYRTKIKDYGCIQHEKYHYIGASPDGINVDKNNVRYGRMLEIKNIVNREITRIPKTEYWIQTQIQMETCDLDKCDFVETRFKEYETKDEFELDAISEYKGLILYYIKYVDMTQENIDINTCNVPYYKYMPLNVELNERSITEWINKTNLEMESDNYILYKTIYWKLDEISCVVIHRNKQWFKHAQPKIKELWDIIEKERIEGYEHRAAKKRTVSIDHTQKENKCLVKLDNTEI